MAEPSNRWWRSPIGIALCGVLLVLVGIPVLRAVGLIAWPWIAVLAPFTMVGILLVAVGTVFLLYHRFPTGGRLLSRMRAGAGTLTPAPDQLEPPAKAGTEARIFVQYPELLAAVCHGFRERAQQPAVLGRPVTDPWGIYAAAVGAGTKELRQVRVAASKHARRFAATGREKTGKNVSNAQLLKNATQTFRRCAARTESGRGNADCTFEHVTTMFGIESPNRDAQLRSIAPKVRALLEREYPQLATARLDDGSRVKYADWQKEASRDRKDLTQLRKEHKRLTRRLDEATAALEKSNAQVASLESSLETAREEARRAGRAELEGPLRKARAALERAKSDHAHAVEEWQEERDRLLATIESLTTDRENLEHALFTGEEEEETERETISTDHLPGTRVLLVGGHEGHVPPIRNLLTAHGVDLLHDGGSTAVKRVAGADLVVLWTRFMDHPTYYAMKRECRVCEVPFRYWWRTSPESLVTLIARAMADNENVKPA